MTGQACGVLKLQSLIFGTGTGPRLLLRSRKRSGTDLLSRGSKKSAGAAVTAGVPSVGRAGTSVGQQFVQPLTELEDD